MENRNQPLINLGLLIFAGIVLDAHLREKKDSINYVLFYHGQKVYHGICLKHRLQARLSEHRCQGKVFDEYDCNSPRTNAEACHLEELRVYRDQTKYNVHYR
jgi:hypothetical protein